MTTGFAEPGLGDEEYPGFPTDVCPEELPDLSDHHSLLADIFKAEPDLYQTLRSARTRLGVGLGKCIKPGMDIPGHKLIKVVGAVAGDAECYASFQPLFDKLLEARYGGSILSKPQSQVSRCTLTAMSAEPFKRYVVSSEVTASRNLQGLRFVPAANKAEKCEAERLLVRALLGLEGALKGDYLPLRGSETFPAKPGGMTASDEQALAADGIFFHEPDSPAALSSGSGLHWPSARGVFVNEQRTFSAWVNEEEQLKVTAKRDYDLQGAYSELRAVLEHVASSLQRDAVGGFAKNDRLGHLNSNPTNLGIAMKASMTAKLPLLKSSMNKLSEWCRKRGLIVRPTSGRDSGDLLEVCNAERLGISEEQAVNLVVEGVCELVHAERRMETGMPHEKALEMGSVDTEVVLDDENEDGQLAWSAAGGALGHMISSAIVSSCEIPIKDSPISVTQLQEKIQAGVAAKEETNKAAPPAATPAAPPSAPPVLQAAPPVAAARANLGAALLKAADNGSLVAALENELHQDSIKQLKEHVANCFLVASKTDAFSKALRSVLQPEAEDEPFLLGTEDETKAATRIQAIHRGKADRAAVRRQKKEESAAAVRIQAIQRGKKERKKVTQQIKEESAAATRIQAIQRGKKERRQVTQQKKEEAEAAVKIQATFHGKQQRKKFETQRTMRREEKEKDRLLHEHNDDFHHAAQDSLLEKKDQIRLALEASLENGTLQDVLSKPDSKESKRAVDDVRSTMADTLEASLNDGSLEVALQEVKEEEQQAKLGNVRSKIAAQLEASLNDGSLETALHEIMQEKQPAMATVDDVRKNMADQLEAALNDGSLEAALLEMKQENSQGGIEDIRQNMASQMEAALNDGSLEAALLEMKQEVAPLNTATAPAHDMEEIRTQMAQHLEESMNDGTLETALSELSYKNEVPSKPLPSPAFEATTAPAVPIKAAPSNTAVRGAFAILKALSHYDQRVGLLTASIQDAERRILERTTAGAMLEVELQNAQHDVRCLDYELENQQRAIQNEEIRTLRLQDVHRRLIDELDSETLKQRHAEVELDQGLWSTRSELSTAATFTEFNSTQPQFTAREAFPDHSFTR